MNRDPYTSTLRARARCADPQSIRAMNLTPRGARIEVWLAVARS